MTEQAQQTSEERRANSEARQAAAAKKSAERKAKAAATKKAKEAKAKAAKATAAKKKESSSRPKFPEYKSEAAAEKVMKANLAGYKQYQVERDKNRNERGMAKHQLAYKTYKNAYTQLLALRKKAGKGRRNAKAS